MRGQHKVSGASKKNTSSPPFKNVTSPLGYGIIEIDGQQYFNAWFFEAKKIKPVPIDSDELDARTDHIDFLAESIVDRGYDASKPIRVSTCGTKPELDRQLLDGLHRSVALQRLFDAGMPCPPVDDIIVERIPVRSLDQLEAMQSYYNLYERTKDGGVSKKKADRRIRNILNRHLEIDTAAKAVKFFKSLGHTITSAIERNYVAVEKARQRAGSKPAKKKGSSRGALDLFHGSFRKESDMETIKNDLPTPDKGTSVSLICPEDSKNLVCPECQASYYAIQKGGSISLHPLQKVPAK